MSAGKEIDLFICLFIKEAFLVSSSSSVSLDFV